MTVFFTLQEVVRFSEAFEVDPDPGVNPQRSTATALALRRTANSRTGYKLTSPPSLASGQRRGHFRTLKGKMSFVRSAAMKKQSLNRELMAKKKFERIAAVAAKKLAGKAAVAGAALLTVGAGVSYLNRKQRNEKND